MATLDYLRKLYMLKQLAESNKGNSLDTNQLEEDFLKFSSYLTKKALTVQMPRLYPLNGDEYKHFAAAQTALGFQGDALPRAIDISGAFDYNSKSEAMIFMSLEQLPADHYSKLRSYAVPLIEEVYTNGAALIQDFAIHEAVVGEIQARRGELDLREIRIFPERFSSGAYKLEVKLDTPSKTIKRFKELTDLLDEIAEDPKAKLLDPKRVERATAKAVGLRKFLGSLSRYEKPESQEFSVTTNSCIVRSEKGTRFYLYSPESDTNVIVYSGDPPFDNGSEPKNLLALTTHEHEQALEKLTELGFFEPSKIVLQQRIKALKRLYNTATRGKGKKEKGGEFEGLVEQLEKAKEFFDNIINPEMRKKYILQQPAELLEFMIYPTSQDPVVHEILPRLSWNKALRTYHRTRKFMSKFEEADKEGRRTMLQGITANVFFANQQNNDVNVWLYTNHKQLCLNEGIEFKMIDS
jgi:hypothetical protein